MEANQHNKNAGKAEEYKQASQEMQARCQEAAGITRALRSLKDYKHELMRTVPMPVDGLDIKAGKVYFGGHPLKDASGAQQLMVAVGIAAKEIDPDGLQCLFVADPPQMDAETWAELDKFAAESGLQIWVARVADEASGCEIFLTEGKLNG